MSKSPFKILHKIAAIYLIASPLCAEAFYQCTVSVKNVLVYNSGAVNILHTGRNDYTYICNVSMDYKGVSPGTCVMWTVLLEAIKKKNGFAEFYFDGTGSCPTIFTYSDAPVPVYIGDVTP
jgi:hypothetical protein